MATKNYAGVNVDVNEEGYLTDPAEWTKEVAAEIAKEEDIELSDKHYEVLEFLREETAKGTPLTIRKVGKSGIVDIKGLYEDTEDTEVRQGIVLALTPFTKKLEAFNRKLKNARLAKYR